MIRRGMLATAIVTLAAAAGCENDPSRRESPAREPAPQQTGQPGAMAPPTPTPTTPAATATMTVRDEDIPTPMDFEEEAEKEITPANLEEKLAQIEKDLAAARSGQAVPVR